VRLVTIVALAASMLVVVLGEPAHATTYQDVVKGNGPVAYYTMDNWPSGCGSFVAFEEMSGALNACPSGVPTRYEPGAILTAPATKSVKLAGDNLTILGSGSWTSPAVSVELWFKASAGPGTLFTADGWSSGPNLTLDSSGNVVGSAAYWIVPLHTQAQTTVNGGAYADNGA
jgi:hypothetical protein